MNYIVHTAHIRGGRKWGNSIEISHFGEFNELIVSRVLSRTIIHLGYTSPCTSSNLPGGNAGHAIAPLFGLAPDGVYLAAACYHQRGALLPHPFTLTPTQRSRRSSLCCTFRRLTPPRCYLAPYPMEPGLSSAVKLQRLPDQLDSGCYQSRKP